jgi:enterochelin esterase-like enzyme
MFFCWLPSSEEAGNICFHYSIRICKLPIDDHLKIPNTMTMNRKLAIVLLNFVLLIHGIAVAQSHSISIDIAVENSLKNKIKQDGRILIFLSTNPGREPRTQIWPATGQYIFAKNIKGLDADKKLSISASSNLHTTANWSLNNVPANTYYIQAVWDQDTQESRIDASGNIHSSVQKVEIAEPQEITLTLSDVIPPRKVVDHRFVKEITFKSELLSEFWGKEMILKASVLLPGSYFDQPNKVFPVRYNFAGYGGRYTRVNRIVGNKAFTDWWLSDDAPQIINVFLDGEGPFGDSYQMDSENSGPYGAALIEELIPHIESSYRAKGQAKYRFVDGCSTGGWVSLALQLYYPAHFNGTWSYSPDAVEFENYQLINIYKDKNAFVNEAGIERPVMRNTNGEPMMLLREFLQYENVLGSSNSYVTSGGQFSAHNALYSPKGEDGLPKPIFDPVTGEIDHAVAEIWKKYDLKLYAKENWAELGPKIQGKIYIWMGDMDHFYLNPATRAFDDFIVETENPTSDAQIVFTPMAGHCQNYSNKKVLMQMAEKLKKMEY